MSRQAASWRTISGMILAAAILGLLGGCASSPAASPSPTAARGRVSGYQAAYEQGDYQTAYHSAARAAGTPGADRDLAAFIAGLCAQKLNDLPAAQRYLRQAAASRDPLLAADALASLGMVHHAMNRFDEAARELTQAASRLTGQEQAKAYFFAGIAQQKLGRWAQARTSLLLARHAASDPHLIQMIDEKLAVTGFTIQLGAYSNLANAQRLANQVAATASHLRIGPVRLVPGPNQLTLVQVGQFSSFEAARAARDRLGQPSALIAPLAAPPGR